jgi:hypothetical protein
MSRPSPSRHRGQLSSIGWIDFSSTDRERVSGVLALLSEAGTLDELSIGQLRDAFSDSLFPGFSTIQTRAKYFVSVPQIFADYWALTPRERGRRSLEAYLRDSEDKLAEALVKNHMEDETERDEASPTGIIGRERVGQGGAVRRPSSAYWTGLRKFGLIDTGLSLAEFCRSSGGLVQTGRLLGEGVEIDRDEDDDVMRRQRLVATVPGRNVSRSILTAAVPAGFEAIEGTQRPTKTATIPMGQFRRVRLDHGVSLDGCVELLTLSVHAPQLLRFSFRRKVWPDDLNELAISKPVFFGTPVCLRISPRRIFHRVGDAHRAI